MQLAFLLVSALPLLGQPLRVLSELARIDGSGNVVAPVDPREILSPALARNAFTSFQIAIQLPPGTHYWLYLGQNPENAVRTNLYKETAERLEPVQVPYQGEGTQVFWMDVWTARDAPVRRVKVEPQLHIEEKDWVVYPMEARVMEATVPDGPWPEGSATPAEVMKSLLCRTQLTSPPPSGVSIRALRFRNAQQDVALARRAFKGELLKLSGACDAPLADDAEGYLRIRDYLFRMR